MKQGLSRDISRTGILAAIILLTGIIKIPSVLPGGEFQLSAPVAILICALFGFKSYITAGILASILGLMLGVVNTFNIIIAMVFRLVAGLVIVLGGSKLSALVFAGPLGTIAARLVLAYITQVDWQPLLLAAFPGMLYTAIAVLLCYKPALTLLKGIGTKRIR